MCVCALHCAQFLHIILHRTDLIIFPLTLRTIVIALMMSIWGKGVPGHVLSPKNCPSTSQIWITWTHLSAPPKQHLDRFRHFAQLTAERPHTLQCAILLVKSMLVRMMVIADFGLFLCTRNDKIVKNIRKHISTGMHSQNMKESFKMLSSPKLHS